MDTVILGLNSNVHDGSAALVVNGKLVGALSMERLNRYKKHYKGNDEWLITHLLNQHGLDLNDITHIAFPENVDHLNQNHLKFYNKDGEIFDHLTGYNIYNDHNEYYSIINNIKIPAYHIGHHLSHAAYAFYTSRFKESHCLTVDASWFPHQTSMVAYGNDNKLNFIYHPHIRIGCTYGMFTEYIGLGEQIFKAGSLMGLASYGEPIKEVMDKWKVYTDSDNQLHWHEISSKVNWNENSQKDGKEAMDIAATIQKIFENEILYQVECINDLLHFIVSDNICLSGGSFLNCNLNSKISEIKNVSVSPACGDDGLSAGSALYLAHHILNYPRIEYTNAELAYLGGEYPIPNLGVEYNPKDVAKMLNEGKIIAWYQGKSEFGPRALGNRSLLANPTISDMKDILNHRIKKREWFRPFAPSVLVEKYQEWFDNKEPSPFMLFTSQVKKPELVPAITHVDNSARIQTVDKRDNPRYWEIISEFEKLSGVPMLLNTSLNINGEPIVETPEDAIRFLRESDCDGLVLGDRFIEKVKA